MRVRDQLAEVFADEPFANAFGVRGAPGLSARVLSLVTVLQFAEDLTDRQAAAMAVRAMDWKYTLGAELTGTGFDASMLSQFRTRLARHDMERVLFDRLLDTARTRAWYMPGQAAHRFHPYDQRGTGLEPSGAWRGAGEAARILGYSNADSFLSTLGHGLLPDLEQPDGYECRRGSGGRPRQQRWKRSRLEELAARRCPSS
ncbi:transposase [Streptomyces sp. NPDC059680]|uniref:transposase n=1 Tax=Streptomyces sp. NPDC059680 TaxID=3346904 RepID=UPI00368B2D21